MANPSNQEASPDTVGMEVKRGQALELRIGGASYREISRTLGISVGSAHDYVTAGLEELRNANAESTERVRSMEVARLDAMLLKLWPKRDQPRVADTILRISERRSRLLGLDMGKGPDDVPPPPPAGGVTLIPGTGATVQIVLVSPEKPVSPEPSFVAPASAPAEEIRTAADDDRDRER